MLCSQFADTRLAFVLAVFEWGRGSGDFTLIGIQLIGVLFIFSWTFTIMGIYFYALNYLGWLRIDPLEEEVGMDISRHKGSAYDLKEANVDDVKELETARLSLMEDRSGSRGNRNKKGESKQNKMVDEVEDSEVELAEVTES